MILKIPKNSGE